MNEPVNPYASPQAFEPPQRMPAATPFAYARPYRSAAGKARVAVWATAATLFLQAMLICVRLGCSWPCCTAPKASIAVTPAAGQANDVRHYIIAGLSIPAAITSLISLLVWIYAAHANLPRLRGINLEFSGWLGGWLVLCADCQPGQALSSGPRDLAEQRPGNVTAGKSARERRHRSAGGGDCESPRRSGDEFSQ